jgi:hydroxylamine oxidation protein HaoB
MADLMRRAARSRLAPALLILAGGLLAGLAFWPGTVRPEFPYRRTEQAVSSEEISKTLGFPLDPAISVKRVAYFLPNQTQPIADALALTSAGSNSPLTWENHLTEPVLSADASLDDLGQVLKAINSHVADEDIVLAWWDLSRIIRLIGKKNAPLDDAQGRGLIIPKAWEESRDAVKQAEADFWKGEVCGATCAQEFSDFTIALLKPENDGANDLERLARGRKAFVAVRLSDVWRLASERPDLLSLAYKDFPGSAQSHGVMKQVREWLKEAGQDYPYAVEPIGSAVRIHYLPKPEQQNLLIAKLLPFTTTNPLGLSRFQLVFQYREYWVYRLVAAEAPAS